MLFERKGSIIHESLEIPYVALKELIETSEKDLNNFLSKNPANTIFNTVPTALFRRIVSVAKKIVVNTENGLTDGIDADYRGLFETYLGFEYIFKEIEKSPETVEKRLKYYVVNHHYMLLETAKDVLKRKEFTMFSETEMKELKAEQEHILESPELCDFYRKYKEEKKKNRNRPPHWFSVESKYNSFNQLAKYIGKDMDRSKLMSEIYSILSKEAHGQTCLLAVKDMGNTFGMKTPLNVPLEMAIHLNMRVLHLTRAMLFSSLVVFNTYIFTENEEHYKEFLAKYSRLSTYLERFEC